MCKKERGKVAKEKRTDKRGNGAVRVSRRRPVEALRPLQQTPPQPLIQIRAQTASNPACLTPEKDDNLLINKTNTHLGTRLSSRATFDGSL